MTSTLFRGAAVAAIAGSLMAAPGLIAPDATVGRNLQTPVTVRFSESKPHSELKITIASSDPRRLLVSEAPDKPGSASIVLTVPPQFLETPMFWLQGRADKGSVTYTASAEGLGKAKATVNFSPSAIAIIGPFRSPKFPTTVRAMPSRLTIVSAALDKAGKIAAEQQVAGGSEFEVDISNSNPAAGKLRASKVALIGGSSFGVAVFEPLAEGETTLAPSQPPGFQAARHFATVTAEVKKPGMSMNGEFHLGKNLQQAGTLLLGEPSPPGGLDVTITSADPSKLLLSAKEDEVGSASIVLKVPAGQYTARYYLQGLADAGIVTYEAKAPGFKNRESRVGLAPSGVIVAYDAYGPPDRATVVRKGEVADDRAFQVSLRDEKQTQVKLVVWTVYIDPESGRAADITVQPLRAGIKATVNLTSSNPEVGAVLSPLTIDPAKDHVIGQFTALAKGVTTISVDTPPGFATPKNATSVPATVND